MVTGKRKKKRRRGGGKILVDVSIYYLCTPALPPSFTAVDVYSAVTGNRRVKASLFLWSLPTVVYFISDDGNASNHTLHDAHSRPICTCCQYFFFFFFQKYEFHLRVQQRKSFCCHFHYSKSCCCCCASGNRFAKMSSRERERVVILCAVVGCWRALDSFVDWLSNDTQQLCALCSDIYLFIPFSCLFVCLFVWSDPVHFRPRVCSLPEKPYNPRSRDDIYRLRNFSITSKGVVNRGDAIISRQHSRSNTSINSTLTV